MPQSAMDVAGPASSWSSSAATGAAMDQYSEYIAKSRYARYVDSLGRREHWHETVDRYVDFVFGSVTAAAAGDAELTNELAELRAEARSAILKLDVMPSMRAMMTAGRAAEADNTCMYNCSYLPIDDPKAFDEAMFVLMSGTGVGFSVENANVRKLPEVPEHLYDSDHLIRVHDSRAGWAKALRVLVATLYAGEVPRWDVSRVRPAGARLKTFGGRASGPGPLVDLFEFVVRTFRGAAGRKLRSIEVHDVMCKIGEVVVAGGVRRCLPAGSQVHTRRGLVAIEQIAVGTEVLTASGEYHRVKRWLSQGVQRLVKVVTAEGFLKCTANHRVAVVSEADDDVSDTADDDVSEADDAAKRYTWKSAGDLRPGDRLVATNVGLDDGRFCERAAYLRGALSGLAGRRVESSSMRIEPIVRDAALARAIQLTAYASGLWCAVERFRTDARFEARVRVDIPADEDRGSPGGSPGRRRPWRGVPVLRIVADAGEAETYDLEIAEKHEFYCEGYLVHNSALISLSDLDDDRMRAAKSGPWWEHSPHRALANNSAVYAETPPVGKFMKEWLSLYESRSGERGIFNREACRAVCRKHGRDPDHEWGTNPCLPAGAMVHTRGGLVPIEDVAVGTEVLTFEGYRRVTAWYDQGMQPLVRVVTDDPGVSLTCTPNHRVAVIRSVTSVVGSNCVVNVTYGWTRADELAVGDDRLICVDAGRAVAVVAVEALPGLHQTYDIGVEDRHEFFADGLLTHNCSEVVLRPYQFCNLTEVVVRPHDTLETLKTKVRVAAALGTLQSTFTKFPYLRRVWKRNTDEERLLGVSLTGVCDNAFTATPTPALHEALAGLRDHARATNAALADRLGIPRSAAITCVKPSGTVSQLVDAASGVHPRHSAFYVRRVRASKSDPLTAFVVAAGVAAEDDLHNPATKVLSFAKRAPAGLTRADFPAVRHLDLWLCYQRAWCEHKPSVTVNVREAEWPDVGAWVWRHFAEVSGVSFLPYDGGSYRQAPYEECTEAEYHALKNKTPRIDWAAFEEDADHTDGARTLACTAGGCDA